MDHLSEGNMKKTRRASQGSNKVILALVAALGIATLLSIIFTDKILKKIGPNEQSINIGRFLTNSTSLGGETYKITIKIEDLILTNEICGIYAVKLNQSTNHVKLGLLIPNNCYTQGVCKGQQFGVTAVISSKGFLVAKKIEKL